MVINEDQMMRSRIRFIMLLLALVIPVAVFAGDTAEQILTQAKAISKKAGSLQGGWVTTEKLIKKAESAMKKGDGSKALALAKKAKYEAELSLKQAEDQLANWAEPSYIKR